MEQAHLLQYRTKDGKWEGIPYGILDMYTAYESYCAANNITPVDKDTYYRTLGELETKIEELNSILSVLGDAQTLNDLLKALNQNVLPTTAGGTGCAAADFTTLIGILANELQHDDRLSTPERVDAKITKAVESKLDSNKIAYGKGDPNSGAPVEATIYFQFED